MRERSYSCKSQWNSVDRTCTKNSWNPIYNAEPIRPWSENDPSMIREWSENDPTTHETVSQPSHRRRRSSRFGDGLCMEKHRLSCICYLSKTAFRARLPSKLHRQLLHQHPCNPIYIAGTILELQITMEFCRPRMHEKHLKPHLQCGTDPTMIRTWSEHDPTTHETVSQPSHRRGRSSRFGDGLCMEKHRLSCICYLSKTHFVRDFLQNSIGNSSTSTTCNPIYSEGTILQLQITMEFCRPRMHEKHLKPHLQCGIDPTMIRTWSEHDPSMIRPHTRPSRNRRTAEVDHRGSGTDFVWKNIGFRASAISQKRISCETSFKTPSATPPPAPLAIPFTVREQFLWLTRSLTNSFFANSFFALSLTNSFFANSFFDYLTYPD